MASYFVPPTAPVRPLTTANTSHPAHSLFVHYRPHAAGTNVWLMPGGVVTTVEPAAESDAVRVFHGGHIHPVDAAEAAALVAAGFTVIESTPAVQDGPLPGGIGNTTEAGYGYGPYGSGLYGDVTGVGFPSGDYDSDITSGVYVAAYEETYT